MTISPEVKQQLEDIIRDNNTIFSRIIKAMPIWAEISMMEGETTSEKIYRFLYGYPECPHGKIRHFDNIKRGFKFCARSKNECHCNRESTSKKTSEVKRENNWFKNKPSFSLSVDVARTVISDIMKDHGSQSWVQMISANEGVVGAILAHTSDEFETKERIWQFMNPNTQVYCKCGNNLPFNNLMIGYRKYCSSTCEYKGENHSNIMKKHWSNLTQEEQNAWIRGIKS
ncbi:MAG: hypothetical protein WC284_16295 [Candidimonas sp.]